MRWRTFCETVDRARRGARRPARRHARRAARRRPAHAARSRSPAWPPTTTLVERLGLGPATYEGPTGITGVLHGACAEAGHAVGQPVGRASRTTSPPRRTRRRALALVRRLEGLVGVSVDAIGARGGGRRLRAPGQPRRPERPRRPGVRRAPRGAPPTRRSRRSTRPTCRPATSIAREFQRFLRQRGSGGRRLTAA